MRDPRNTFGGNISSDKIDKMAKILAEKDKYTYSRGTVYGGGGGGPLGPQTRQYTGLLCHFEGADEATTYTADTGQAITMGADAKIDSAQKKFGSTSLCLDGTDDYATFAKCASWNFDAKNFTVEMFVRFGAITTQQALIGAYKDGNNYWYMSKGDHAHGDLLSMEFKSTTVKGSYVMAGAWSGCAKDTWYHLAFVRHQGTGLIFINGTSQTLTETTAFGTNNVGVVDGDLTIGAYNGGDFLGGWIDELRISYMARWSANFTAPTAAYELV